MAQEIERIKAERRQVRLDDEQVRSQAQRLIAQPTTTRVVAETVALEIERAISGYMRLCSANLLPEGMEGLHPLPRLLREMAEASQDETQIEQLEGQIKDLVAQVAKLTADLEAAQRSSDWKIAKEQFIKTTAVIGTTTFWAAFGAGCSYLIGHVDVGGLIERFGGVASEMPLAAPTVDLPTWDGPIDV